MNHDSFIPPKLALAIADLNSWAEQNKVNIEIIVIGAIALFFHGLKLRATNDIDTLTELDNRLLDAVVDIGAKWGLGPHWLNDQASGLSVPEGFESRLTQNPLGSCIIANVPARQDLIALKAAAFVNRGGEDPKDYADLLSFAPSREEIDVAIIFVRKTQTPPNAKFYPDFEDMIRKLYDLVR